MFKQYLRKAMRILHHRKGRIVLEVISVAIGIGCCATIITYIIEDRGQDPALTQRVQIEQPGSYDVAPGILKNANSTWICGQMLRARLLEIEKQGQASI